MKSLLIKRSIVLAGHRTSVSVEDAFWEGLKTIAEQRHESLAHVVASIDADRQHARNVQNLQN
jgi:predicted DNA-binding ribbon-helix-helix protein